MPKTSTLRLLAVICLCVAMARTGTGLNAQTRSASPPATAPAATPVPAPQPESSKRVQDVKFFSKALQREMQYRVVLPKGYFITENRYPVLYLLHGLTGHYRSFEA
ncbi:MAG TPA: hypothetical protein VFQ41_24870, partial [Candidatus Angelobacter sp.]|nr:hypothetical protein [Candidatus Angelobacter sp.]